MNALSVDEKNRLIELVVDEFGSGLAFDDFAAVLRGYFDDIPGLETMGADEANEQNNLMWSQYHG
ncbi:MAG: hypothetical protein K0M39_01980 [Rhizobium sp.]|nr:hypothetical protein [Rhizobium sp.]